MASRSFLLSDDLHAYVLAHSEPADPIARALTEATAALGDVAIMQIGADQAALLTMLVRLTSAKVAVEVGTFTGTSALAIARGLPDDGTLLCCDTSEEWTSIGVPYWRQADVASRIDLRIAPALATLQALPRTATIDFSFIDADKPSYADYFEELVVRTRPNGLIVCDNTLFFGLVHDGTSTDENAVALRAFNDLVARDARVDTVLLPYADGLTLLRKR